jgi:hypothetical protein
MNGDERKNYLGSEQGFLGLGKSDPKHSGPGESYARYLIKRGFIKNEVFAFQQFEG